MKRLFLLIFLLPTLSFTAPKIVPKDTPIVRSPPNIATQRKISQNPPYYSAGGFMSSGKMLIGLDALFVETKGLEANNLTLDKKRSNGFNLNIGYLMPLMKSDSDMIFAVDFYNPDNLDTTLTKTTNKAKVNFEQYGFGLGVKPNFSPVGAYISFITSRVDAKIDTQNKVKYKGKGVGATLVFFTNSPLLLRTGIHTLNYKEENQPKHNWTNNFKATGFNVGLGLAF
jgi:hypothetical protein